MIGYRIPPKSKSTTFLIGTKKNRDQPVIELIYFSI